MLGTRFLEEGIKSEADGFKLLRSLASLCRPFPPKPIRNSILIIISRYPATLARQRLRHTYGAASFADHT